MLAALLAGIGLSVSGVLLQGVTDNGLASPNIIGVNSGAGFLTILTLSCFPHAVFALPFAAFFGADVVAHSNRKRNRDKLSADSLGRVSLFF